MKKVFTLLLVAILMIVTTVFFAQATNATARPESATYYQVLTADVPFTSNPGIPWPPETLVTGILNAGVRFNITGVSPVGIVPQYTSLRMGPLGSPWTVWVETSLLQYEPVVIPTRTPPPRDKTRSKNEKLPEKSGSFYLVRGVLL